MSGPWEKYAAPAAAPAEAGPWAKYAPAAPEREQGMILPMSWDKGTDANVRLDWNAGLPGALIRAFNAPGDVVSGKIDAFGPEGAERAREMATMILPSNPALRAGERALPGVLQNTQKAVPKVPTAEELKTAASAGYKAVRETGAEYPGQSVGGMAEETARALEADGLIAETSPKSFAVLNRLRNAPEGSVATVSSLDAARKSFSRIANNPSNDGEEREAARRIVERIDDFIQGSAAPRPVAGAPAAQAGGAEELPRLTGPGGVPVGPSPTEEAARLITEARGNADARFRSDRITGVEDAAELRASAANSGQNLGNAFRQRVASLLLNPRQTRGFSPEELAALREVVDGTATTNTLRYVSNLLGGGGGIGQTGIAAIGAGFGSLAGGVPGATVGAALPPMAGAASRTIGNRLTARQLQNVDEMVRRRSPLYERRVNEAPMTPINPMQYELLLRSLMLDAPQQ